MPLTGIDLSASNLQLGGDGEWDIGGVSPPQTIVGSFAGQGSITTTIQVTLTSSAGQTYTFSSGPFSQNLSQNQAWTITLPQGARDWLNALPPGDNVDVAVAAGSYSDEVFDLPIVVCFATGTLIATARGEVPVEDLRVGDLVLTAHGGAALQPVVWIGHGRVNVARHPNRAAVAPVLIRAGALADGVPHRDLRVSPDHAMFLDGRLVPAKHLVNGTSIIQETWCPDVTYWHVELPAHGLLVSEGAVSESYFDDGNRKHFDNYGITTLFKDFASERQNGRYADGACYPLLEDGPLLERIRARIAARAERPAERRSA